LTALSSDKDWRIRSAAIECIPSIAQTLNRSEMDQELLDSLISNMKDPVSSVRNESATTSLSKLTEIYGSPWAKEKLLEKLIQMTSNSSWKYRLAALFGLTVSCFFFFIEECIT
jgi:HEAT repeat protein